MTDSAAGLYKATLVFWTTTPVPPAFIAAGQLQGAALRTVLVPRPEQDPDWPGPAGQSARIPVRLLCDRCYEAVTGELAQCQPGCRSDSRADDGPCLWPGGPSECQWCGRSDRLTPVPLDHPGHENLPAAAEHSKGTWFLRWRQAEHGPYPTEEEAWDAWHASGELTAPPAPAPAPAKDNP